jgi:rare lipoprotein A
VKVSRPFHFTRALAIGAVLALVSGCGKKPVRVTPPEPAPPVTGRVPAPPPAPPGEIPANPDREPAADYGSKPLYTTRGLSSWYGPPYHNRKASNGEVFDMNAMTAASLTLPLGSIVRVTNVKSGDSAIVRINDRGPFVPGRILDLSLAAAKKIGTWRVGVAEIKLEVLQSPVPLDSGGRWCVQIGGIKEEDAAASLQARLRRRYREAKVIKFVSPVGVWWVRVRVAQDERARAEKLAHETETEEGTVFLVRLD